MKTTAFDHIQDKSKVRVLSYTRISTRKQIKGTGLERQIGDTIEWCEINGFTLDESDEYQDKGKSAFSGANTKAGELAILQQKLVSGEIAPGSILIVEAFDEVRAKAEAAVRWCAHASNHTATVGGKPWRYLLVPHDDISESKRLSDFLRYQVQAEEGAAVS